MVKSANTDEFLMWWWRVLRRHRANPEAALSEEFVVWDMAWSFTLSKLFF